MVNQCTFIGRLGQDPEIRDLQSGDKLATFSMALSENWKDKSGEKQSKTTWINCSVFGKQAEIIQQYVHKGDLLYIEAKVQVDQYEKEGVKMTATKFVIKNFTMLGSKNESAPTAPGTPAGSGHPSMSSASTSQYAGTGDQDDDLPF